MVFTLFLNRLHNQDVVLALSPQLPHKLVFDTTQKRLRAGAMSCRLQSALHIPRNGGRTALHPHFGVERGGRRAVRGVRQERDREHRIWESEGGLEITFSW